MTEFNGEKATIREVYALVEKRADQILTEFHARANRTDAELFRLASSFESMRTAIDLHVSQPGHPEAMARIEGMKITLAKYAGGLAVVGVLLTAFSRII